MRYLQPVPMGQTLRASANLVEARDERVFTTTGELRLADGSLAATASAVFAVPRGGGIGA